MGAGCIRDEHEEPQAAGISGYSATYVGAKALIAVLMPGQDHFNASLSTAVGTLSGLFGARGEAPRAEERSVPMRAR